MSIEANVWRLVDAGKLIHRPSSFLGSSARDLFVTPEIYALAHGPFADTALGERHAALAQYLDAFCEHNEITVCQNPRRKPWDVMLARVAPEELEFWSMRITDPEETAGMRILGGFCGVDAFVGLTCDLRENIPPGTFHEEVADFTQTWSDYFGAVPPHYGENLDDYLTSYYEVG